MTNLFGSWYVKICTSYFFSPVKFVYSEKAATFEEISLIDLMWLSNSRNFWPSQKNLTLFYFLRINACFNLYIVKFIYSEKATKFCEIFPLLLTVCTVVKCKGKISQNFVTFSEYMNFTNPFLVWSNGCERL